MNLSLAENKILVYLTKEEMFLFVNSAKNAVKHKSSVQMEVLDPKTGPYLPTLLADARRFN